MIERKTYECEYCGKGFDYDEYNEALKHERDCNFNPKYKKCASCENSKIVIHCGVEYIRCNKLRPIYETCNDWENK